MRTMTSACFVLRIAENVQQLIKSTLWVDLKLDPFFVGRTVTINEARVTDNDVQLGQRIGSPIVVPAYRRSNTQSISADMTGFMRRWARSAILNRNRFSRTIAVTCTDCPPSSISPVNEDRVIVELTLQPSRRRSKRGSSREFNNLCGRIPIYCCLQRYTLDFSRVGWQSWVVYPDSFTPNYCMGSCQGEYSIELRFWMCFY